VPDETRASATLTAGLSRRFAIESCRLPFGRSPLLQQGELDFSPAKENLVLDGLSAPALLEFLP